MVNDNGDGSDCGDGDGVCGSGAGDQDRVEW